MGARKWRRSTLYADRPHTEITRQGFRDWLADQYRYHNGGRPGCRPGEPGFDDPLNYEGQVER